MALWQKRIEEVLGIERTQLKKVLQPAKQLYEGNKKTVSAFVNKHKAVKTKTFIKDHKAGAVIVIVFIFLFMINQFGNENQPSISKPPPATLFEHAWKND